MDWRWRAGGVEREASSGGAGVAGEEFGRWAEGDRVPGGACVSWLQGRPWMLAEQLGRGCSPEDNGD